MISFNEINKIFNLSTKKTTYAFGVFENKCLVHLYWGKKLIHLPDRCFYKFIKKRSLTAKDCSEISTDTLPLEFSTNGYADMRNPTLSCVFKDGSRTVNLKYAGYEITDGKPDIKGLPHTYAEEGDNVQTLTVRLFDELKNLTVYLNYTVFENLDAISRSVRIENGGEDLRLDSALSMSVDFFAMGDNTDILHLDGAWARERHITRNRITYGDQHIESRYGASSAMHNPFFALCDSNADETKGDVYGFSLVYSGSFTAGAETNPYCSTRAYIGINPANFEWQLKKGESFETPETVLVYSPNGFGQMSRIYHKLYRTRLCRGKFRDAERYVLINNWEATYFNFNEDKIYEIAKKASEIGIDTMVLDDGWFGKRNDDKSSLGDWFVNTEKLPNGLKGLAERVNSLGMKFGLWFEPEMVCPVSELYEKHPDWALHTEGRKPLLTRNQLTLDLSRKDVCDYIINAVSAVLNSANIEYVKWDMNRYMTDIGSSLLPAERQGEVMHRYMLGLYYVLETLTTEFPDILFESCASGGGRFDPGMLYYMPQVWTSDDSDAVERLMIQYGTSFVYPYSTMGAHVSACPNHQVGRTTPFEMRCNVAMPGQFGFELDLGKCSDDEIETAGLAVKQYRELGEVFHKGDCYRLMSPFESEISAVEFVSEDGNTVICCINSRYPVPNSKDICIKFCGLDADAEYKDENSGQIFGGDYLMNFGIIKVNGYSNMSEIKKLIKI